MAGIKELKARIKSVQDTEKITNAMYLVACAKYRSNHDALVRYTEYYLTLDKLTSGIISSADSPDFGLEENGKDILLVFGADKGLAGDFNKEIFKAAVKAFKDNDNIELYVIGKKVRDLLTVSGIKFVTPDITVKTPDNNTAEEITNVVYSIINSKSAKSFSVIYTECNDGINSKVIYKNVLPVTSDYNKAEGCEFIPSENKMIEEIMPIYLKGVIRNALLQSFCSEQNARMNAMKNANDNAKELLSKLSLEYNHTRQNAITREIIEISGERKNR